MYTLNTKLTYKTFSKMVIVSKNWVNIKFI